MTLRIDPSREEFEAFLDLQLGLVGLRFSRFSEVMPAIYAAIESQFALIRNRYYREGGEPILRLGHNGQYTAVLYQLARAAFTGGDRLTADKVYALMRMVSAIDLYYEVELPQRWFCDHPLASVIGRGKFSKDSSLVISQNCNIGNNGGKFPDVRGNLYMYPNTSLLGNATIQGNVVLANGACVIDAGELTDCIVFGRSPELTIKPLAEARFLEMSSCVHSR